MRERPYHLAFVLTSFARGGMEMRLADTVNHLDPAQWNSHVYALYDRHTMHGKIPAERLHTPLSAGKTDLRAVWRLASVLRRNNTTVVWSLTQGFAAAWGRLAGILAGVPVRVLSIHDNAPLTPATRALSPWTHAIVTNSRASAAVIHAQGIPAGKLHVLYNGIDTEKYKPGADRRTALYNIPAERPVILNVGRLFPEKGREVMLQAAAQVIHNHENPPLVVFAGDGILRGVLEKLAQELGIAAHVRFLGIRDDVPELLRACDVVVMSSRDVPFGESCPNILLEGMATERPVIGTNVGGAAELVQDGQTGFIIPPENPAALAEKLHLLLQDAALRRQMGAAGRVRVVAQFTIAQMIAARADLLTGLIPPRRA